MADVTVVPEVLHAYAGTNAAIGSAVSAAGSMNAAANTAVMVPVFGLIGQEFLAAFIATQAAHLLGVGGLAAVHAGTAAAAVAGAADFEASDAQGAAEIGRVL